ncbi:hypothetical protein HHJ02_01515 [Akkermansia muciniphila]|jgi:hypothetical protein|uniref:Uncharacterized protein n=1 Tax=Akkermansia muciniphila TaxID=239935 RepID=A0AAP8NNG1_9BACT|nr:hypothetical protein [Akkermansia muciniphila]AYR28893.1 hypothetical protein CUB89_10210 [Akkermansia muciniphila]MBD9264050.1 hypothetical protein [Akkermansia muciniphila]MBT8788492.1 hypothetical protein [Akkermansia muciniphila]MBT8789486.1 hypothetical protein [Akkermansia muciniphila]PNC57852.1 hypothetical protein CXU09_01985 [Akkermansia muciniphila]
MFFQQGRWNGKNEGFGKGGQKILFLSFRPYPSLNAGVGPTGCFSFPEGWRKQGFPHGDSLPEFCWTGTYQAFPFLKK